MTSILPAPRPAAESRTAVLGLGGPDLLDLTEAELASVIEAANAAATDALLRIRERREQAAGEERAASASQPVVPLWPAPAALGPETFGERLRLRALAAAMCSVGLACWAAPIVLGVWS